MLSLQTYIIILIVIIVVIGIGVFFVFKKKKTNDVPCKKTNAPCTKDSECCKNHWYNLRCSNGKCITCPTECTKDSECCDSKICYNKKCLIKPKSCDPQGGNCAETSDIPYKVTINADEPDKMVLFLRSSNCNYVASVSSNLQNYYIMQGTSWNKMRPNINLYSAKLDTNFQLPDFSNWGATMFLTADGDLYLQAMNYGDDSDQTKVIWRASTRGDNLWSKGTGPPYTLMLDDCGNLTLFDSQKNITFNSKSRYFCDSNGNNCKWQICPNNYNCSLINEKYSCECV